MIFIQERHLKDFDHWPHGWKTNEQITDELMGKIRGCISSGEGITGEAERKIWEIVAGIDDESLLRLVIDMRLGTVVPSLGRELDVEILKYLIPLAEKRSLPIYPELSTGLFDTVQAIMFYYPKMSNCEQWDEGLKRYMQDKDAPVAEKLLYQIRTSHYLLRRERKRGRRLAVWQDAYFALCSWMKEKGIIDGY